VAIQFAGETQTSVILGERLGFVPVLGDERVGEEEFFGFGLVSDFGNAGAGFAFLNLAAHGVRVCGRRAGRWMENESGWEGTNKKKGREDRQSYLIYPGISETETASLLLSASLAIRTRSLQL